MRSSNPQRAITALLPRERMLPQGDMWPRLLRRMAWHRSRRTGRPRSRRRQVGATLAVTRLGTWVTDTEGRAAVWRVRLCSAVLAAMRSTVPVTHPLAALRRTASLPRHRRNQQPAGAAADSASGGCGGGGGVSTHAAQPNLRPAPRDLIYAWAHQPPSHQATAEDRGEPPVQACCSRASTSTAAPICAPLGHPSVWIWALQPSLRP